MAERKVALPDNIHRLIQQACCCKPAEDNSIELPWQWWAAAVRWYIGTIAWSINGTGMGQMDRRMD